MSWKNQLTRSDNRTKLRRRCAPTATRCGIARALDVVGERWALLVVRDLLLGPKRFTDLRAGLPDVSPDVLVPAAARARGRRLVARRQARPAGRLAGLRADRLRAGARAGRARARAAGAPRAPFPDGEHRLRPRLGDARAQDGVRPGGGRRPGRELRVPLRRAALPRARARGRARDHARGAPRTPDATIDDRPADARRPCCGAARTSDDPPSRACASCSRGDDAPNDVQSSQPKLIER